MVDERQTEARCRELAVRVIGQLREAGSSLSVAESLTGGLLCATLTEIPGASETIRGGAVTYATEAKHTVLGVDATALSTLGPVSARVATEMASGASRLFSTPFAIATTGVAGPETQDGVAVGTVYLGVWVNGTTFAEECHFEGSRRDIRLATVQRALELVLQISAPRS